MSTVILAGTSLEDDIESLNKVRWNWQQILRGLQPHEKKLKQVHLVGSSGAKGSFDKLDLCTQLIRFYFSAVEISQEHEAVDFEKFNELIAGLDAAIHLMMRKFPEREIIIDVTGGQKTTSIAGAAVTMNSNVTFQYVSTNEPYQVWAYDVAMESPLSI